MAVERIPGFCALCRSRCGAQYLVDGGRLVGVEPWPEHPTGGALCPKGRAAPELLYHPRRLTRPLRRTRPKTDPDPGWVAVPWDEALQDIAAQLVAIRADSGAEAVAFSAASPGATALSDSLEWIERLIHCFGSPNFITGVEICNWHRDHGHAFSFGHGIGMPDYARTDLVILWGFNPGNVWLAQAQALAQARARGARLLVVDPAPNRHARAADLWLRVRPGADAALALGIAHLLVAEGRFDEDFVRRWSNGPLLVRGDDGRLLRAGDLDGGGDDAFVAWDLQADAPCRVDTRQALPAQLARRLALRGSFSVSTPAGPLRCRPAFDHYAESCAGWTPAAVEAATGVPPQQLRHAARLIAGARAVSYFCWTGISQHVDASQADRAIALLMALTGCIDAPGGNLQPPRQPAACVNDRAALLPAGQVARTLGLERFPLGPPAHGWVPGRVFYDAVLSGRPYRVRALVGFGANLLMAQADTARARQALQALEFQVHCDLFETPTAASADYLLPVNTPWEREGLRIGFEASAEGRARIQLRPALVAQESGNEARSDLAIVFELARRLGLGAQFFGGSVEAGWNHQLAPLGLDVAALRAAPHGVRRPLAEAPYGYAQPRADGTVRGFATPSRRVEFHAERLLAQGQPPVPVQRDALAAVALDAAERTRHPLILGTAKSGLYCQSQHRALPSLRRREPEPVARLHPALAQSRAIAEGDWMRVRTRNGEAQFRARFDAGLDRGYVQASFGFWQACDELGLPATDPMDAAGSHYNRLVDTERMDALSGSIALRAFPCEIAPATGRGTGWAGWKGFRASVAGPVVADVLVLALQPDDGAPLPPHQAGQYVPFALTTADGRRLERSYSLLDAADGGGAASWHIAVKRSGGAGGLSQALHALAGRCPEFAVSLQPPRGRFLLPVAARCWPVVLAAAGIGITPFIALLESWVAAGATGGPPVLLLYGSRDAAQQALAERLAALAARLPFLQLVRLVSHPSAHGLGAEALGHVHAGLVPAAWIARGLRCYLCGPEPMLRQFTDELRQRGVPAHAIFREHFRAAQAAVATAAGPFAVHFARSGRTLHWTPADGSLLALGAAHGIALPSGCRVGQCESCLLTLRSGTVVHRGEVELDDARSCLTCLAVPASDLVIEA